MLGNAIVMMVCFTNASCLGSCVTFHGLDSNISWQELEDADAIVVADLGPPGPPNAARFLWSATRDRLVKGTKEFWHSGYILLDEYLPPAYNSPHCEDHKNLQVAEVLKGPAGLLRRDFLVCGRASRTPAQLTGRQIVFLERTRSTVGSLWYDAGGIPKLTHAGLDTVRQAVELQAAGQTENHDIVDWTVTAFSQPGLRGQIDYSVDVEEPLGLQQEERVIQSLIESPPERAWQLLRMAFFFSDAGSARVFEFLASMGEACEGEPQELANLLREYRSSDTQRERYLDEVRGSELCESYSSELGASASSWWQELRSDLSSNVAETQP